jgi:putative phosphoribosyl transferase
MAAIATRDAREVSIPADRMRLAGTLTLPGGADGIVLFAHGSGSSRNSPRNRFVAERIAQSGLGTLLFDLLTRDEEAEDTHTGHLRFDIGLLARRLNAATLWLRHDARARGLALGYFGASTGAGAALVAAAALGDEVRAVVSRGGRPDLAGSVLPHVAAATLLIVGGLDTQVIRLNQKAYDELRCDKALQIVPGATHLFEEPGALERVAELAVEWFRRFLAAKPGEELRANGA